MIRVNLSEANFEYDIHSLVKAFFPKEEVRVSAKIKEEEQMSAKIKQGEQIPAAPLFTLEIRYEIREGRECGPAGAKGTVVKRSQWPKEGAPAETVVVILLDGKERARTTAAYGNRPQTKNRLKQALYRVLSAYTQKTLPWGTLTGIRPTKLPMAFLEEGRSPEWIRSYMRETYFASGEKIDLSIEIAGRELALLQKLDYEEGYSLYLGIPFCPSTCLYCSFTSFPLGKWAERVEEYLKALEREIDFTAAAMKGKKLNAIYIGGGTPTTLTAQQLDKLFTKLEQSFDFSWLLEYTVEAGRPDSITREKLLCLRQHGITRISINPQTMKQETLDRIGRRHTTEQVIESFHLARELGFENINMDFILGLPGETPLDVKHTMECLRTLVPDSVTVHSLAVKRGSRLHQLSEEYPSASAEEIGEMVRIAACCARKLGQQPYYLYRQKNMAGNFENVGYSLEGKAGIYNILIMEEKQTIIAVGAGSISKRVYPDGRIERCENVKDVASFIERIDEMIERKRKLLED